ACVNTMPAVILNIQRQPGANIISVSDRIKTLLPQLQASLPSAVKVSILTDRTETIRASVKDVQFELMLTVALVVMVIFLFLRNLSATVIPRSEEHTSELQSHLNIVCRLLLDKKKQISRSQ